MAGKRPDFKLSCKSKKSGEFVNLAAFWIGDKGIGGKFEAEVKKIIIEKDGKTFELLPENVWLNMYDEANAARRVAASGDEEPASHSADGDEGIPF